jgi:signal transduction histidine kinase
MDINTCFETTSELRQLAAYTHLVPAITSMVLGYYVLKLSSGHLRGLFFAAFTFFFSLWLIGDLLVWTQNSYNIVAAMWAPLDYINIAFFISLLCFIYLDFTRKDYIPWYVMLALALIAVPPYLLTITGLSLGDFNQAVCELDTNPFLSDYKLYVEIGIIASVVLFGAQNIYKNFRNPKEVARVLITAFSVFFFLGIFAGTEYLATITGYYELNLYALLALPLFIFTLTLALISSDTFDTKNNSTVIARLIFIIFLIVGVSNYFLAKTTLEFATTTVTMLVTLAFGVLLYRSASRESRQRHEIEELANDLAKANVRLQELDKLKTEFVSIASHQLRSPLTAIRGYASLITDGTYGPFPEKLREPLNRIEDSSRFMALSVDDFLNVSRIESGSMKYEKSNFSLSEMASRLADDLRPTAMKKGLVLLFRSDAETDMKVNADNGKLRQVIQNVVDNALKYTQKGTVSIVAQEDVKAKKARIIVVDTGVGMSENTQKSLFGKFVRAKNANTVNVFGTGLGLYIGKQMLEAMGGTLTATSKGEDTGSTFTIELPLAK